LRPEIGYLLVGFNPTTSEKKHIFWKYWDEQKKEIELQKYYFVGQDAVMVDYLDYH
jgi:hypothetical protein